MKCSLKKIIIILVAFILVCGAIYYFAFGRKVKLQVYSCLWEKKLPKGETQTNKIIGTDEMMAEVDSLKSDGHNVTCKKNYKYLCKYSDCKIIKNTAFFSKKYSLVALYDNNKNNDGGYYLINLKNKETLAGPYKDMKIIGDLVYMLDAVSGKYSIFSLENPKMQFIMEKAVDEIKDNNILVKDNKYGVISKLNTRKSKLMLFDFEYDYIELSSLYLNIYELHKDNKVSYSNGFDGYVDSSWHDYAKIVYNNIHTYDDIENGKIYLVYVDGKELHFVNRKTDIVDPVQLSGDIKYDEIKSEFAAYLDKEANESKEEIVVEIGNKKYTLDLKTKKVTIADN